MQDFFTKNLTTIVLAIIAAIAGAGLIFKFIIKKGNINNSNNNRVDQNNNSVGGDMAGRDINK